MNLKHAFENLSDRQREMMKDKLAAWRRDDLEEETVEKVGSEASNETDFDIVESFRDVGNMYGLPEDAPHRFYDSCYCYELEDGDCELCSTCMVMMVTGVLYAVEGDASFVSSYLDESQDSELEELYLVDGREAKLNKELVLGVFSFKQD